MTESSSRCPYCGREYPLVQVPGLLGRGGRAIHTTYCGCEGEAEAEREAVRERRKVELTDAWRKTGAPEEYWGVTPDYDGVGTVGKTSWLYLWGPRGTGKTTRACALLKAYVARNQRNGYASARFMDVPSWLASMRRDWGSMEEDAYQRAAGVKLLVLDDLGKGKPTEWAMERMFRLVSDRWSHHRATIFTSQYSLDALAERCAGNGDIETAEAMASRIYQRSTMVEMGGRDLRTM